MTRIIAVVLLILGFVLLGNTVFPILGYEIFNKPKFEKQLLSPLVSNQNTLGAKAQDLTKASNWFSGNTSLQNDSPVSSTRYYTISIPKLKIDRATVEIGGENLAKNLIHYQGTALPGKRGNAVIFGHSVLPQFFNPKNYLTIFSTLPTIKKGDNITVDYDGITYNFRVSETFEVEPNEIEVLRQYQDGSHLTLITCVPPGTYLRRLVVRADLIPPKL